MLQPTPERAAPNPGQVLLALIAGQIGLHAAMAGVRMAAPLQALRAGHDAWSVGLLLALYAAAPVFVSLYAGRMADRHGYHRPVRVAVALAMAGCVLALVSTLLPESVGFRLLCVSAVFAGTGANVGLIVIQRRASHAARDHTERMRVFSWLGVAPSLSNVIGPVLAGVMIDAGGFRLAYAALLALPLLSLACARRVPREHVAPPARAEAAAAGSLDLLRVPGMARLLCVNWLLSACWDAHALVVPILGYQYGFSASTIGLILGTFTLAISAVRLVIPLWAHRMRERVVLRTAMLATGAVLAVYPLAHSPWLMGGCAALLGLALGSVQPMIMTTLYHLTPDQRHGESIAMRSMAMNASSTVMPLMFGAAGTALGAAAMFWVVAAAVAAGSWLVRRLPQSEAR